MNRMKACSLIESVIDRGMYLGLSEEGSAAGIAWLGVQTLRGPLLDANGLHLDVLVQPQRLANLSAVFEASIDQHLRWWRYTFIG